ncbi:MAG: esterase family protein [Lachnospiraceae bacterium]|nr:esterase family protein [Lachnospiraceae bacterium]
MNIPENFLNNQTFDSRAIGFNRQLIPNMINGGKHGDTNIGYKVNPDGSVFVCLYGSTANEVTAGPPENLVSLTKQEDGMWTGTIQYEDPGLKQLLFYVDGVRIINPLAPIGYGWGYGINYIEVPDPDQDYILIRNVPHGTVSQDYFFSTVTGEWECCYVYTPPGYRDDLEKKYPVLYLQHGGGENEACWTHLGKVNFIMDNLLAEGKAVPFIIVMNNAMMQVNTDGHPHLDTSKFNEMVIRDSIPFIESHYRVISDKKARAVAGLSMGSLLSGEMIMEHIDLFGSAGLFTGYTYPVFPGAEPRSQEAQLRVLDDAETFNREVDPFFGAIGDHEVSLPLFEKEREYCRARGINYIQKIYPGYHEWRVWRAAFHDYAELLFRNI